MKEAARADLAAWVSMHVQNAGMAVAEFPSTLAQLLSRDCSDLVFERKTEDMATRLEDAARMIRKDIARAKDL